MRVGGRVATLERVSTAEAYVSALDRSLVVDGAEKQVFSVSE